MKIQIEDKEFILESSAALVRAAYQAAKVRGEHHQIVKALIERFPAVRDMDLEDLLQFIAVLPTMHDAQSTVDRLTREHFKLKDKLTEAQKELGDAKAACRAVSDARLFMTDGSLSNEIENAVEAATKIGYAGEVRPYPPALGKPAFVVGGDTEP